MVLRNTQPTRCVVHKTTIMAVFNQIYFDDSGKAATLKSWSLVLHGTSTDPLKSAAPTTTPLPPTEKTIKDTYAENGIILPDDPTFHEPIVPPTAEKVTPLEEIEEEILNHIPTILSSGEQTDTDLLDPTSQPSNDINNNIDSAGNYRGVTTTLTTSCIWMIGL